MPTNYPASLDSFTTVLGSATTASTDIASKHNNAQDAIAALEAKVGVNNSADSSSIDYQLRNPASSNPGHVHTVSAITDFNSAVISAVTASPEAVQDIVGAMLTDSASVDFTYNDGEGTVTATVIADSSVQKVEVARNGTLVGTGRKRLNFIEGTGISLTVADDSVNNETDITFTAGTFNALSIAPTASISYTASSHQTVFTLPVISANTLGTAQGVEISFYIDMGSDGFGESIFIRANSTDVDAFSPSNGTTCFVSFRFINNASSSSQVWTRTGQNVALARGTSSIATNSDLTFAIRFSAITDRTVEISNLVARYI